MTLQLDARPRALDLLLWSRDGFSARFTFTDKVTGDPWPATGTWAAQVRVSYEATDVLADFTVDMTDAATGVLVLSLSGADVLAVAGVPLAVWDLQQLEAGAEPRTWFAGVVQATGDVTR